MRRLTVLITTLSFALSGLFLSPASTAELVQLSMGASTLNVSTAIPATFGANVQSPSPNADFSSISCPSTGNCVAAGRYKNVAGGFEAFTQTQTNGSWATAVPATFGANVQDTIPAANLFSVSCSSAGNCVAAGVFTNAAGGYEGFTQTQTNGSWAIAVPATFGANVQSLSLRSDFSSVSCPSAGNCVAAGSFRNAAGGIEAFTQTQTNGSWAIAVPVTFGANVQNTSANAFFSSISCPSAGNCVAAGSFTNADGDYEAFTQTQTNGSWAIAVPVTFGANVQDTSEYGLLNSISCPSAGNCVAAGQFRTIAGNYVAFTQTQTNGSWATAIQATFGANVQNAAPNLFFDSVFCSSVGNCVAGGRFLNVTGGLEAFTQTQTNGSWATAVPVTFGANVQNTSEFGWLESVSCSSAGNCVGAGWFRNPAGDTEAFTQTQTNGSWATAVPVTFGANVQNTRPDSYFFSTSCSSAGNCIAAGIFKNAAGDYEAFTQSITGSIEAPPVAPPVVTPAPTVVTSKATSIKLPIFYTSSGELTVSQKTALKSLVSKSGKKATFVITGSAGKLPGVSDPAVKALAKKRGEIAKAYLVKLGVSKSKITIQVKITNQGTVPKAKILAKYLVSQ